MNFLTYKLHIALRKLVIDLAKVKSGCEAVVLVDDEGDLDVGIELCKVLNELDVKCTLVHYKAPRNVGEAASHEIPKALINIMREVDYVFELCNKYLLYSKAWEIISRVERLLNMKIVENTDATISNVHSKSAPMPIMTLFQFTKGIIFFNLAFILDSKLLIRAVSCISNPFNFSICLLTISKKIIKTSNRLPNTTM